MVFFWYLLFWGLGFLDLGKAPKKQVLWAVMTEAPDILHLPKQGTCREHQGMETHVPCHTHTHTSTVKNSVYPTEQMLVMRMTGNRVSPALSQILR